SPSRTNFGQVQAVKFIYDKEADEMYYMNTKRYRYHFTFAAEQLGFKQGNNIFNRTQYLENDKRYLYPGSINYYKALDVYVLQFVAANEIHCENIQRLFNKLKTTAFFKDKLVFFPHKKEWEECPDIPTISSDELYQGQNYQALNLARGYGYLRKVELTELEETYLGRREVVLLNGIPNDVSVVAGIITTEFQTPLSHINVLSNSRATPNMALKDGWENPILTSLLDKLVYLEVGADSFIIREAALSEAEAFWKLKEPQVPVVLEKNTQLSGLVNLHLANHHFVDRIGGKAANFAELMKVQFDGVPIPLPEGAFAIPFHYYQTHIEAAGLDIFIQDMLADPQFIADPAYRQEQLDVLRDSIKAFPIDAQLLDLVRNRIGNFADFPSYRFRSSTNAEDLESFSGAGLYTSKSAKENHGSKTIENAIRKVWASLWNWRAFEERAYFKIDHESCAMGILVHRSFPDEDANGVLLTRNLYNENPGFIVNVQYKEYSIVFPEPGILHDQLILFAWSIIPDERFMVEYLTHANLPELNGQRVMTDEELHELGDYAMAVKLHFWENVAHDCACDFIDFAVDIEFKVDSDVSPRKLYLKQARLFK
ncbi:MAG: PEP/pyruvate-binding domain-containing protein, partial [Bacteroidota bacterium]